ncbi:MAG: hypothetical protein HUK18_03350 [Bacteroidales bacterium]|nr:hypothetical protein [Bacteroidales bacterium]
MLLKKYKSLMLPLAIIIGVLFSKWLHSLVNLVPFFVFMVLFFAYSGLNFHKMRITKLNIVLLIVHFLTAIGVYWLCTLFFNPIVAKGVLVGVICPVAAAASAVVVALGGNREICVVHILLDNFFICIAAPIMFSLAESSADISFIASALILLGKLFPVVILPLLLVILLRKLTPNFAITLKKYEWLSILFWSMALLLNMAATGWAVIEIGKEFKAEIIIMIVLAFVMCVAQFGFGRLLGRQFNEKVVCAQAIGQKNTGLGIWMAYTYFSNPLTTMYAAAYAVFQNIFNSIQMYLHDKKKR